MEFMDKRAVAEILGVSVVTVYRLIRWGANGRPPLPAKRFGRAVRIRRSDFEAWIASQPTPATPKRGRPKGSTKAAMIARRAAEAMAEK